MFRLGASSQTTPSEAGSLNERINLFGFIDDHTFLTKSGDVGVAGGSRELITNVWIQTKSTTAQSGWSLLLKSSTTDAAFISTYSNGMLQIFRIRLTRILSSPLPSRTELPICRARPTAYTSSTIYFVVLLGSPRGQKSVLLALLSTGRKKRRAWRELRAFLSTESRF